jgi:hypothetical protein
VQQPPQHVPPAAGEPGQQGLPLLSSSTKWLVRRCALTWAWSGGAHIACALQASWHGALQAACCKERCSALTATSAKSLADAGGCLSRVLQQCKRGITRGVTRGISSSMCFWGVRISRSQRCHF